MKRILNYLLISAFLFSLLVVAGCGECEDPLDVSDGGRIVSSDGPSPGLGAWPAPFSDDFEAGLDPGVWVWEYVNSGHWIHQTETGNGYIHSLIQSPVYLLNRFTDILTVEEGFDDFVFTWDMRFLNDSFGQDRRQIYFRCDDNWPYIYGYTIHLAVGYPYGPDHWLHISKHTLDGSHDVLSPTIEPAFELNKWFSFKLEVLGNSIKLRIWEKGTQEPSTWDIDIVDPGASFSSGRIGFGNYWWALTDVDNVMVSQLVKEEVAFDIKPGSCPNPLNTNSDRRGVLPAAILGTEDLDVSDIDVSSILLEGIAPASHAWEDVATPAADAGECACTTEGPDGYTDLTLKFDVADIIAVFGSFTADEVLELKITGELYDGTQFEGVDCVRIIVPGKGSIKTKE